MKERSHISNVRHFSSFAIDFHCMAGKIWLFLLSSFLLFVPNKEPERKAYALQSFGCVRLLQIFSSSGATVNKYNTVINP